MLKYMHKPLRHCYRQDFITLNEQESKKKYGTDFAAECRAFVLRFSPLVDVANASKTMLVELAETRRKHS